MLERFEKLSTILIQHEQIWRHTVFKETSFPALDTHPELKAWLTKLPDKTLLQLQKDDQLLLSSISPYFKDAELILDLINFPRVTAKTEQNQPKCWHNDIPGRKAKQILAFSHALGRVQHGILEWCCGKQHLGRFLSEVHQQHSLGLEINQRLVQQANQLAVKRHLGHQIQTHQCDVLSPRCDQFLYPNQHVIALHACGGLHVRLLEKATTQAIERISFSPCCYHRFTASDQYEALSKAAKKSNLRLSIDNLRLATRATKTASTKETAKRRQLQAWRLGFDCLQRDLRKIDEYLETPSLNASVLQHGFKGFCLSLTSLKNINIKHPIDFEEYEIKGLARFRQYERAELLRMAFRRVLESWLILDRVLFLEEHGYHATVSEFCSSDISPRNFFIDARLEN